MNKTFLVALFLAGWSSTVAADDDWKMQPVGIQSRWAALVSPTNALPEYPRPQMVRSTWTNLNGLWQYAITAKDAGTPNNYDGQILVPYPLESALSGVQKRLQPDQILWYRRTIMPDAKKGARTLLNFGAVDWQATVYVNGTEVGSHQGGYENFSLDITDALKVGSNELIVKVADPTDTGPNPHGKQDLNSIGIGITYTPSSGIWQTLWLETVPGTYIESISTTPDVDGGELRVRVNPSALAAGLSVKVTALSNRKTLSAVTGEAGAELRLPIRKAHLWSPDDPYLYDLKISLLKHGKPVDEVKSYFGMRKIEIKKDEKGIERIFLNNVYTYNLGTLDQGFWPDGLYTAPTDEALKFDIQAMKAMGFNTIRKHIKVEPERWYYHCDTLGMLVWQDMVNPGNDTPEGQQEFEAEAAATLKQLHNHPSITTWVLFNEGWGAYDQERLTKWMKSEDPSRIVDGHTGEERFRGSPKDPTQKWPGSDVTDIHPYPGPDIPLQLPGKARVIGEFGGLGVVVDDHVWDEFYASGSPYRNVTAAEMTKSYEELTTKLKDYESQGLTASIYTQPYDVEGEQNGLMTYDRAVIKIPLQTLQRIHASLVPTSQAAQTLASAVKMEDADTRSEAERYVAYIHGYEQGDHSPKLVRHLILKALRAKSEEPGVSAERELINQFREPYSSDQWAFIAAATRTTSDAGFDLLQHHREQADAALKDYQRLLSNDPAERRIRSAIVRSEIDPRFTKGSAAPDWNAFVAEMQNRYGPLGAEAAYQEILAHSYNPLWLGEVLEDTCSNDFKSLASAKPEIAEALRDPHSAESRHRDALMRDTAAPFFARQVETMEWNGDQGIGPFLTSQTDQHGLVGFSAVCSQGKAIFGGEVLKRFLPVFERSYVEYFKTAYARSNLNINEVSWLVVIRSKDAAVLSAAVAADKYSLENFEPNNPAAIDTYASLLYKIGRVPEALQYEKRAVELSGGKDDAINVDYEKMQAGKPTWPTS